jgi:hypothetical protein
MADNSTNSIYVPNTFGLNSFLLTHNGESIFYKEFNGESGSIVDIQNDIISIKDHFFNTGEPLTYKFPNGGSALGISTTSPGNILGTTFLPEEVYPISVDYGKIRIALTKNLAESNQYVNFTSVGVGTLHSFECDKQNSKCLIAIDNIIQSPISIGNTVKINSIVNSTTLELDSLEGITQGTILKIGDEYAKVISVKYNGTNVGVGTVTIFRGPTILGTNEVPFDENTDIVTIMSGQYNIVENKIYFTDSPFQGRKYTYTLSASDFSNDTFSFNIFNSAIKTGTVVGLSTQNPPQGLDSGVNYFAIKNYENNFSFAENYQNAISGIPVEFTTTIGQYDELTPIGEMKLNVLDVSGGSSFSGRAFLRSEYSGNTVFDDISPQFNGISTSFELKSSGISTIGISSDNGIILVNNIFQYPEFDESFYFEEIGGNSTNINFIGIGTQGDAPKDYDVNVKGFPRGGIIVGYGLSGGSNYQQLKQAKLYETFKNDSGDIYYIDNSNIGIAYSGSGYRQLPGYAASVTFEQNGERISGYGTAIIQDGFVVSVNVSVACTYIGIGSTPSIVIEPPFEYDNVLLSGTSAGIGAKVSFDISDSGEVKEFRFTNPGYGYSTGDILTIPNTIGTSDQTEADRLKIIVLEVGKDTFSAWNLGNLRKLDDLTPYVNGSRKIFNLLENSQLLSLETLPGSPIDIEQNILLFVNDVLQIPGESYSFNGGTQLILSEPPPVGSTVKVYFYTGSTGDMILYDIDPKIKIGDNLKIKKNIEKNPQTQIRRTVKKILSSDKLRTEIYNKKGLTYDSVTYRPVDFTPQNQDLIIGGELISKARESLNSIDVGFTSVKTATGSFSVASASTIGINTSNINIGDYVESIYTDSYKVISIDSGVIGISTSAANQSVTTSTISIWRKI